MIALAEGFNSTSVAHICDSEKRKKQIFGSQRKRSKFWITFAASHLNVVIPLPAANLKVMDAYVSGSLALLLALLLAVTAEANLGEFINIHGLCKLGDASCYIKVII